MKLIATFMIRIPKGYSDSGLYAHWIEVSSTAQALTEVRQEVARMNEAVLLLRSVHAFEMIV